MPDDILQSIAQDITTAIRDEKNDKALVSVLEEIKQVLKDGNSPRAKIAGQYAQNLNSNNQFFNAREFAQFMTGLNKLSEETIKTLNGLSNSAKAIENIMQRGGLERFQRLLQNESFGSLDQKGRREFISAAAITGVINEATAKIFESVVNAFEKEGKTFSENAHVIEDSMNRLTNYELQLANTIKKLKDDAPSPHWKGGDDAWLKHQAAKQILKTDSENEFAKREVASAGVLHTAGAIKGLTRSEKKTIEEFKKEYSKALTLEDRERVSRNLEKEMKVFATLARPITVADRALLSLGTTMEDVEEDFQRFCKGTPKGMNLVGLAIAYAGKKALDFLNQISGVVKEMAKLDIQTAHTRASFDSLFGGDSYNDFRKQFSLTRREMQEMSSVMTDAYRNGGVEMDRMLSVAQNIKGQFGELDMGKFQEAVNVMSGLTREQTMALAGASMDTNDLANMYTSLARNRNAGRAADLLEQGVFGGEPLIEGVSEGDRLLIEQQKKLQATIEDIEHYMKSIVTTVPEVFAVSKIVSAMSPVLNSILAVVAIGSLFGKKGAAGNAAEQVLQGGVPVVGGKGGKVAKISAGLVAGEAVTMLTAMGFGHFANKYEGRAKAGEELINRKRDETHSLTGLAGLTDDSGINYNKVYTTANRWGRVGAGIGGTIGTGVGIAVGAPTMVGAIGSGAAGGLAGSAIGGGVGFGLGYEHEMSKQMNKFRGNVFFKDASGNLDTRLLATLQASVKSQRELVGALKEEQRTRVRSLRAIERTQIILEKVEKGLYSPNAEANIAFAKRNIENAITSGGSAEAYRLNVLTILENNLKQFSDNVEVLMNELRDTTQMEGIDEEARLEKTREILTKQADVTDKFVETMVNSIGEYEKIPDVIVRSIQSKIDRMNLDFRGQTLGGTSAGYGRLSTRILENAVQDFKTSLAQYSREQTDVQSRIGQLRNANQERINAIRSMGNVNLPGFNTAVTDVNGNVDELVTANNQQILSVAEGMLDRKKQVKYGINRNIGAVFDKFEQAQKSLQTQNTNLASVSKDEWNDAKREEFIETLTQNATAVRDASRDMAQSSTLGGTEFGKYLRVKAQQDAAGGENALKRLEALKGTQFTQEQARAALNSVIGNQSASIEYKKRLGEANSDAEIKAISTEINKARNIQSIAGAIGNDNVAMARANEKTWTGLLDQAKKVADAGGVVMERFRNDPVVRLLEENNSINEANSVYLKYGNRYSEHLERTISNQSTLIAKQVRAGIEIEKTLTQQQKEFRQGVKETIAETPGLDQASKKALMDLGDLLTSLDNERIQYSKDGRTDRLSRIEQIEAKISKIYNKNQGEAFTSAAEKLETIHSPLTQTIIQNEQNRAQTRAAMMRQFEQNLAEAEGYRGTGRWRTEEATQGSIMSRMNLAGRRMNVSGTGALWRQGIQSIGIQGRAARNDIQTAYDRTINDLLDKYRTDPEMTKDTLNQAMQQATATFEKSMSEQINQEQQQRMDMTRRVYDIEKQRIDLAKQGVDIQLDYLQSIGAPFQEILKLEQQRVAITDANYRAAVNNVRRLKEAGADELEIRKAEVEMQQASAEKMKAAYGAQNSALEKMFGNMIGAFSSVAGIIGPNNLAAKYGMGYTMGANGTVLQTGKTNGAGLAGRKLAASSGLGRMESEVFGTGEESGLKKAETPTDIQKNKIPGPQSVKDKESEKKEDKQVKSTQGIETNVDKIREILEQKWGIPEKETMSAEDKLDADNRKLAVEGWKLETEEANKKYNDMRFAADVLDSQDYVNGGNRENVEKQIKKMEEERILNSANVKTISSMTPAERRMRENLRKSREWAGINNNIERRESVTTTSSTPSGKKDEMVASFKPATVVVQFNSEMFKREVVELVVNEIKQANA